MSEQLREVLRKAEIKRVGERLSKKELCNIYDFNYNFYMNCVSCRNYPSQKMVESLHEYLRTPTAEVYKTVFASRERETKFHKELNISKKEEQDYLDLLAKNKYFDEPQ